MLGCFNKNMLGVGFILDLSTFVPQILSHFASPITTITKECKRRDLKDLKMGWVPSMLLALLGVCFVFYLTSFQLNNLQPIFKLAMCWIFFNVLTSFNTWQAFMKFSWQAKECSKAHWVVVHKPRVQTIDNPKWPPCSSLEFWLWICQKLLRAWYRQATRVISKHHLRAL